MHIIHTFHASFQNISSHFIVAINRVHLWTRIIRLRQWSTDVSCHYFHYSNYFL